MTYQFEYELITTCHNFRTGEECPMFEFRFDSGYCKLSRKMIYEQGRPEWCELVERMEP